MQEDVPDSWESPLDPLKPMTRSRGEILSRLVLIVVVFISGAAVMIYEFLAVRFLQRNFGSSLDVWAAEIAVCMAGLAIGYVLGGFLSEKSQKYGSGMAWRYIGKSLAVAGTTAFLMETAADALGEILLKQAPSWWHPLLAAGACSFLPLTALGSILPQAIQMHVVRLDKAGRSAGWMSFVSTFGSIVGVLVTAIVLLPRYGVREISILFSTGLVIAGALLAFAGRIAQSHKLVMLVLLFCLVALPHANATIIFEKYTAYHHILVEDTGDKRILWFDRSPQSTMSRTNPIEGGFEYTDFFHVPLVLYPTAEKSLFIGLGGGTGPKVFLNDYPWMSVDVVEIDPIVVNVAYNFFALPDTPRMKIFVEDGRQFLRRSNTQYGVIVLDAYASGPYGAHIPFHLATREFFTLVKSRLLNGGSVVYNVIGKAGRLNDELLRNMGATMQAVFDQVLIYEAASSLNTVFVARRAERVLTSTSPSFMAQSWPAGPWLTVPVEPVELVEMGRLLLTQGIIRRRIMPLRLTQLSRLQKTPLEGNILTDNYAPVDMGPQRLPLGPSQ